MTTTRRPVLRSLAAAGAIALLTLLALPPLLATAADRVAFSIPDPRITESSGLARDVAAQLYWTVNDSGGEGSVFGVTGRGTVKGVLAFRVQPTDVEAVAMHGRRLYVADIGDNSRSRRTVSVYYFDYPQANNQTVPYHAYDFAYPDGPHDAETLLVDGRGRLYVVTKELRGGIYAAPAQPSRRRVNPLRRVGDAPAFVTDGVILPTGRIVLRTYVSLSVLDGTNYRTLADAATPWQRQGESVALSLDGKSLLLGSEGKDSEVLQVDVPRQLGTVPTASSKPPRSPTDRPSGSATTTADPAGSAEADASSESGAPTGRNGTLLALALAGLVALCSGVVVAVRRR